MLGRRPVYVTLEELKSILGLPEEVNVYDVRVDRDALYLEIVSAEPIDGLTIGVPQDSERLIRRISVRGLKEWNEKNKSE